MRVCCLRVATCCIKLCMKKCATVFLGPIRVLLFEIRAVGSHFLIARILLDSSQLALFRRSSRLFVSSNYLSLFDLSSSSIFTPPLARYRVASPNQRCLGEPLGKLGKQGLVKDVDLKLDKLLLTSLL